MGNDAGRDVLLVAGTYFSVKVNQIKASINALLLIGHVPL